MMSEITARISNENIEDLLEKFNKQNDRATNHNVFDEKFGKPKFDDDPRYVYFYRIYLKDNRLAAQHFFYHRESGVDGRPLPITPKQVPVPNGGQGVEAVMTLLMNEAHDHGSSSRWYLRQEGDFRLNSADPLKWTVRSYIAFVFDDAAWQLVSNGRVNPAIEFDTSGNFTGNHSFYDAFTQEVPVTVDLPHVYPETGKRTVFCMINHMKKNVRGDDHMGQRPNPKDPMQMFKFDIRLKVLLAGSKPGNENGVVVIIDPVSGNEGPPDEP